MSFFLIPAFLAAIFLNTMKKKEELTDEEIIQMLVNSAKPPYFEFVSDYLDLEKTRVAHEHEGFLTSPTNYIKDDKSRINFDVNLPQYVRVTVSDKKGKELIKCNDTIKISLGEIVDNIGEKVDIDVEGEYLPTSDPLYGHFLELCEMLIGDYRKNAESVIKKISSIIGEKIDPIYKLVLKEGGSKLLTEDEIERFSKSLNKGKIRLTKQKIDGYDVYFESGPVLHINRKGLLFFKAFRTNSHYTISLSYGEPDQRHKILITNPPKDLGKKVDVIFSALIKNAEEIYPERRRNEIKEAYKEITDLLVPNITD